MYWLSGAYMYMYVDTFPYDFMNKKEKTYFELLSTMKTWSPTHKGKLYDKMYILQS